MNKIDLQTEILFKQINSNKAKEEIALLKLCNELIEIKNHIKFKEKVINSYLDGNILRDMITHNPKPINPKNISFLLAVLEAKDIHWVSNVCGFSEIEIYNLFAYIDSLIKLEENERSLFLKPFKTD